MHLVFLIEDLSGKTMLQHLVPKMLNPGWTFEIHSYRGLGGKVPQSFRHDPKDAAHRIFLAELPKLLAGFGKTFQSYGADYPAALVIVCDLDDRDRQSFLNELTALRERCNPKPVAAFCLAIEEGEAWLLGDVQAIEQAFPNYNRVAWSRYRQDAICGTWEVLADVVYDGGCSRLKKEGPAAIGRMKSLWADKIAQAMDVDRNRSPSFCHFRDTVRTIENVRP